MTSHQGAALAIRARQPRWTGPVPAHPSPAAGTGPAARGVHGADGVPGAEKPRRILVVDDEPHLRSFIGRALAAADYLIGFAGSGSGGLRHALDDHSEPVLLALLLRELAEHFGQSVPKGRLLASVWGYHFDPGSNVVDVCVRRLRSKLGFSLIKTVRGEGYQLGDG